jgi:Flp pilus assembly protein TadG
MTVLLAVVLVALVGMTGLGVDFAFATLERRVLQNATDAAAASGAINLARGEDPTGDVDRMMQRNNVALSTTVVCQYVDDDAVTGPCNAATAATTNGVRVTATNIRPTYFMPILGVPTVTVSATAAARVLGVTAASPYPSSASLFIVCGINTKRPSSAPLSILQQSGGQWVPNPAADGQEFVIHNPQVADCGMGSNSFKGLNAVGAEVGPISLPFNMITETGTRAGPTTQAVRGEGGCSAGLSSNAVDNCTMIIPVFVSSPAKDVAYSVRWLAFHIRQIDSNTHYGRLDLDYPISQESYTMLAPWTKNTKQVLTVVRLWN